jgi:outer membrane protein
MTSNSRLIIILAIVALLIAVFSLTVSVRSKRKIGFIVLTEVFNEFKLKKEMESKYTAIKNARKKILDSLQIDISILSRRLSEKNNSINDKDLFERKKIEFNQKLQIFEEDNNALSKDLDSKIISQLNQYVNDYGKTNGFDIIYGNSSDGSIMFGTAELNITKDVIEFINLKYEGVK